MNCKYFSKLTAWSLAALPPIGLGQASFAENFNTYIDENGNAYCIGIKSGQYYFAGTDATGTPTSATLLNPAPTSNTGRYQYATSITGGAQPALDGGGNVIRNLFTLGNDPQLMWGFSEYRINPPVGDSVNGIPSTDFVIGLTSDNLIRSMNAGAITGIGNSNRIRGYKDGAQNDWQNYSSTMRNAGIYAPRTLYVADAINCVSGSGIFNVDDALRELPPELIARLASRLAGTTRAQRLAGLGRFISAGLLPRNVIAAGGLATQAYVNDLADTILERLPTRQFQKLQLEEEITEVEL